MTTKKQTRIKMEQKRAKDLAETKRLGLLAQAKDQRQRALRARAIAEKKAIKDAEEKRAHEAAKMALIASLTGGADLPVDDSELSAAACD